MMNSLSQIIAEPPSCSQIFQIVYFRLISPTTEYKEARRQGCAITFASGQYLSFFHPPDSQSLAIRMASSFVACRVLFARGIISWPLLCFNNHGHGGMYGRNMWVSASMAHSSLPLHLCVSLHGPDSFLFHKNC